MTEPQSPGSSHLTGALLWPMPDAAPKPCLDCRTLVFDGTSRCPQHKRAPWSRYSEASLQRTRGRKLQRERAALFLREPLCRHCAARGLTVLAVIRDHIKPLAEGGADVDANTQPLCQACSDAKSQAERLRGRGVQISAPASAETDLSTQFSSARNWGRGGL
jgi:5-methylcytosine-specific restriction protein A